MAMTRRSVVKSVADYIKLGCGTSNRRGSIAGMTMGGRHHLSSFLSWSDPPPESSSPPPQNPPDPENPDPATLREQWKYAIGLYSRWYSHAWGTTILAGLSFFAIGWFVKGENPLNTSTNTDTSPAHQDPALPSSRR